VDPSTKDGSLQQQQETSRKEEEGKDSSAASETAWPTSVKAFQPPSSLATPPKDKEEVTEATETATPYDCANREGKMPWFAGTEHCVNWPARSPNSGCLSLDSGLGTQSLREPGAAGYMNPAIRPKNEAEWEALYSTSFDDLFPATQAALKKTNGDGGDSSLSATWQQRFLERVELEKRIFGGIDMYSFMRVAPCFTKDTRFHSRWTGPLFAVGTAVTRTDANDAIYDSIAQDSRAREVQTISAELTLRIAEANTPAKAEELLGSLVKMIEAFEKDKDKDAIESAKLLKALCEARLIELKKDEAATVDADPPTDDDDDVAEAEENPQEEDDPKPSVHVPESDVPTAEEDEDEDEEEQQGDDGAKRMRRTVTKPKARPTVPVHVEFDPTGMSQEALRERLEKMPRPVHVISTVTVALGEDGLFPFELIAEAKTAPLAHTVFAHRLDYKGRSPFEQMTDKTLLGTLWTCSMLSSSQGTCGWRALRKTRIQIPCSFAGHERDLLVVNYDRAYILTMPKGSPTKEVYALRRELAQGPQFKISHCHLSKEHVLLMGFRPNNTRPLVLVYNRKKRMCTAIQTSIPVTSAITSQQDPGTVLLGMKDGTLLRVTIPTVASRKGRPSFSLYYPVVDAVSPDDPALKTLRKARGEFKIDETPIPQDHVLHVGAPLAIMHIVEHRQRIIASTVLGLHLFKLYLPASDDDRRTTMMLRHVISYDWRGNVLVALGQDNSLRMLQLHECRLESTMGAPAGLTPKPPEYVIDCAALSLSDQAIIIVHEDGSRRVLELKDSVQVLAASTSKEDVVVRSEEEKAKSFIPQAVIRTTDAPVATAAPETRPKHVPKKRFVRAVKATTTKKK
jgi:hypothetical protein